MASAIPYDPDDFENNNPFAEPEEPPRHVPAYGAGIDPNMGPENESVHTPEHYETTGSNADAEAASNKPIYSADG
ncbi:hypothetical protein HF325_002712 [Metschnikowia pulcherrima]|uniref:Uncharacterized protein n=1 Tax=Metschnikowia pulcherrima TaxID=27326 RepID=A0A8H7GV07_9ASCO|nr:hypothetical protein HF325_002712 [Metschnikowia pulcherrima]